MSEGVTRALGAPPANQPRLELYKGCTWSQSLVRLLSPHCVTKWRKQFVLNEVVWQTRHDCYSQDQKQTEPERAISINLKLHAVVMSLGKEIEDKLCVEDEVEDEVKQDASPDEKVIYPRPVLRQKWDLTNTMKQKLWIESERRRASVKTIYMGLSKKGALYYPRLVLSYSR